jgi:hypothetical protein
VADVRPEIESKAFGDDFASAKFNDPWLRCPFTPAYLHLLVPTDLMTGHLIARAVVP